MTSWLWQFVITCYLVIILLAYNLAYNSGHRQISEACSRLKSSQTLGVERYQLCRGRLSVTDWPMDLSSAGSWLVASRSTSHRHQAARSPVVLAESCLSQSGRLRHGTSDGQLTKVF